MAELVFFRRGDEVLRFSLDESRIILGRGERCDVVIPDSELSRQHVSLSLVGDAYVLEDLSGKGTSVSGTVHQRHPMQDGEDIALGQWRARYRQRTASEEERNTALTENQTKVQSPPLTNDSRPQVQIRLKQGHQESILKLTGDSFTIGKEPGNDLILQDKYISAKHLKIVRKESGFYLVDHQSTNGTFVGSLRIYEAEVPLPTTVRIGESELILEAVPRETKDTSFQGMIGNDSSVKQLTELIQRVAPSTASVTILGESGTGKELVAKALHHLSLRADKPFIPVNCAAISKELIESELFGHEKGAFTGAINGRKGAFEEADGGTLFLDEIGELSFDLQSKLLRALESGEIKRVGASRPITVDVRIVAATNRDLLAAAKKNEFRDDLYYRLCVIPLHLPPLRNRRSDVMALADHFVRAFSPRTQTVSLTPAAQDKLKSHGWPGNIRELKNVIHRALLLRKGPVIDVGDVSFDQQMNTDTGLVVPEMQAGLTLEQMLEKLERQIVENTLRRCNNNRERVAKELGVARSTLFKRLKDWGLTRQDEADP